MKKKTKGTTGKPKGTTGKPKGTTGKPNKGTTGKPKVTPKLNAEYLRSLPKEKAEVALGSLSKKQLEELQKNWEFWARGPQLPPEGKWDIWFINAGRGFGKTRAGVEWVRSLVMQGHKRIAAVAATNSDIERVMVKGESGFLNCCSKHDKTNKGVALGFPQWSPTKRSLTWDNGAKVEFYSAEEPERLRGPQFEAAWCDELAAWNRDIDTWDMLSFCLRLGKHPQVCVTTTPKPTKLVRNILKLPNIVVTSGSTFDNEANLAKSYLKAVKDRYEGTRLGKQELYAEILEEAEGALWTTDTLEECQVSYNDLPQLNRVVLGIDPAVTANAESDMTGMVLAGVDINGHAYILGDYTEKLSPGAWASKAVKVYHENMADRIVAETNQGGDMVRHTIHGEDETVSYRSVRASRGKFARAEPIAALYERGLIHHVRNPQDGASLEELETQMRTWEPLGSIGSPDRIDALVWALTDLMLNGAQAAQVRIHSESMAEMSYDRLGASFGSF